MCQDKGNDDPIGNQISRKDWDWAFVDGLDRNLAQGMRSERERIRTQIIFLQLTSRSCVIEQFSFLQAGKV